MNEEMGEQVFKILRGALSEITVNVILREKCETLGTTPQSIKREDLKALIPQLMGPMVLFAGQAKAQAVKEQLEELLN